MRHGPFPADRHLRLISVTHSEKDGPLTEDFDWHFLVGCPSPDTTNNSF
jgi:hypothetical protein